MKDTIRKVLRKAESAGAENAEVVFEDAESMDLEVREGEIEGVTNSRVKGLGLRVFLDGRFALAHTNDFGEKAIDNMVESAVNLCRRVGKDPAHQLVGPKTAESTDIECFDAEMAGVSFADKVARLVEMEKVAKKADPRIRRSNGATYQQQTQRWLMVNSLGLEYQTEGTLCVCVLNVLAEDAGDLDTGFGYSFKRHYKDLDSPDRIGKIAADEAILSLGGKPMKSRRAHVVFSDNGVGAHFIVSSIVSALNGELIRKKASYLAGKLGEKIASPNITIYDDPSMTRGIASAIRDGEGTPAAKKTLVENGVLKSYIYDTYNAARAGTESTGNGMRSSYASLPAIGTSNCYIQTGESTSEEIIAATSDGFFLQATMGKGSNIVGDIYSIAARGRRIRNGELAEPVANVTLAGKLSELIQSIDMIGDALEFKGVINAPTFRIRDVVISGR